MVTDHGVPLVNIFMVSYLITAQEKILFAVISGLKI